MSDTAGTRNVTPMDDQRWLAERFEEHRNHLRAVAYRMLGSLSEADDAVQDTWLRFSSAGADDVENMRGWLTPTYRASARWSTPSPSRRAEATSTRWWPFSIPMSCCDPTSA